MPLPPASRRRLGRALFATFVLALVMGPGPGVLLVNPDPLDPEARRFFLGMPIVYAWAAFWLAVQAGCVVAAWRWIWRADEEERGSGPASDPATPGGAAGTQSTQGQEGPTA